MNTVHAIYENKELNKYFLIVDGGRAFLDSPSGKEIKRLICFHCDNELVQDKSAYAIGLMLEWIKSNAIESWKIANDLMDNDAKKAIAQMVANSTLQQE